MPKKIQLRLMLDSLLLMLSSSFTVASLTCKSAAHFEFIFVHGVRGWSSFMLFSLHVLSIFLNTTC